MVGRLLGRSRAGAAAALRLLTEACGVGAFRKRVAAAAVAEERQRIGRDLHDGLAQELAFIAMQSRALGERQSSAIGDEAVAIADAAEHALSETRQVIEALADAAPPLNEALSRAAHRLTARSGATLALNVDPRADASPETGAELLKILSEAVSNGVRHGNATSFTVDLRGGETLRLRIADNGDGFDLEGVAGQAGLGLAGMKQRARSLGGELGVRSRPGGGTEVEVLVP